MIRWVLVVLLALILIDGLSPWLRRLGVGKLPGDLAFTFMGREWRLPLTSTLILSGVCALIAKFL
jgi:hypothetical protein